MKAFEVTAETALEPLAVPSADPLSSGRWAREAGRGPVTAGPSTPTVNGDRTAGLCEFSAPESSLFFLTGAQLLERYHTDVGREPSL